MKIYDVRINGITNPMGFLYDRLICSWKVESCAAKKQEYAKVEISQSPDFITLVYKKEGRELNGIGEELILQLSPYTRYYIQITVAGDNQETAVSDIYYFETAKLQEPWSAKWIGLANEDCFHPELKKSFILKKQVISARLYITGLGVFEASVNDRKAGNEYLAPFVNDYETCVQYMTYDVTNLLKEDNELTILLGNGWYKGRLGAEGKKEIFGSRFAAIAELRIEYEDGQIEVIETDESWNYRASAIEESDIYDGEIINECLWADNENLWKPAVVLAAFEKKLSERYSLPVLEKESINVQEVTYTPKGETVLDMGQNFAGFLIFKSRLPKGTRVVLDFGEVLQNGNFYKENYRSAKSRFVYIADGSEKIVRPHFTFFGFRYVRISGWVGEIKADDFIGKAVYSDLTRTGYIKSSNEKFNRLYENTVWGLKSNFLDMPTDCPQRDERLGWTGDAQVFSAAASYHMDTRAFFDKYLRDLRYVQERNGGKVPWYLPCLQPEDTCSVWGDAATIIPTMLYRYYGNAEALRNHYPLMKEWVDYIHREDEKRGLKNLFDFGFHFGDWLALDGSTKQSVIGGTDSHFIASVYYYASAKMTAEAAGTLGYYENEVQYGQLAKEIKEAIFMEYFSPNGRITIDTQTAYLTALKFGIYKEKQRIIDGLKQRFKKDCYRIKGGFVGATMMCTVLADHGMEDLAYDLLFYEGFPGWLHCVNLGATTIWERWNSVLDDGSISGTGMNSLNHYAYGAVMEFAYRHIAGIQELAPGFKKALIAPKPNIKLDYVKCSYDSAAGRFVSNWQIHKDGRIHIHVEIPFGAGAVLRLPYSRVKDLELEAGRYDYEYMPEKDLTHLFTEESRMEDILKHPEAREIFLDKNPEAAKRLTEWNEEDYAMTLPELKWKVFLGADPDQVQATLDAILMIKNDRHQ